MAICFGREAEIVHGVGIDGVKITSDRAKDESGSSRDTSKSKRG